MKSLMVMVDEYLKILMLNHRIQSITFNVFFSFNYRVFKKRIPRNQYSMFITILLKIIFYNTAFNTKTSYDINLIVHKILL